MHVVRRPQCFTSLFFRRTKFRGNTHKYSQMFCPRQTSDQFTARTFKTKDLKKYCGFVSDAFQQHKRYQDLREKSKQVYRVKNPNETVTLLGTQRDRTRSEESDWDHRLYRRSERSNTYKRLALIWLTNGVILVLLQTQHDHLYIWSALEAKIANGSSDE